jgi:hypothetical protein
VYSYTLSYLTQKPSFYLEDDKLVIIRNESDMNDVAIIPKEDTLTGAEGTIQSTDTAKQPDQPNSPISSPSNYDKKYTDKTHKQIQYGKLLIDLDEYHIVSDTRTDNIETFKIELDNPTEDNPEIHISNVTIRTI